MPASLLFFGDAIGYGRILFGAGFVQACGHQLLKLDETKGRTKSIAGSLRLSGIAYADGPANQAHFGTIKGLCIVPDGTLFVYDANHVIRKITPAALIHLGRKRTCLRCHVVMGY